MLSMSVFSHIRRLRIGEDSLKGDDIDGLLYFVLLFTSSIHSRPLVPRQIWRLTGFMISDCNATLLTVFKLMPKKFS